MSKFKYDQPEERNYDAEARDLIVGLSDQQLYGLYEIVQKKKQHSQTPERDKELDAVAKVIEQQRHLDRSTLISKKRGYRSSMAAEAKAKDGNTIKYKKNV
jgi:hypothetical protein